MVTPTPTARIGVLGTQFTGKTTLAKNIVMELRGHGLTVTRVGRLAKRAAALGLPKMTQQDARATEWLIAQGIADETAALVDAEVVIADGPVLAPLAYYTAAQELRGDADADNAPVLERLRLQASLHAPRYDLLIATILDPNESNGGAHYDPQFRTLVDQHTHRLLADLEIEHITAENSTTSQTEAVNRAVAVARKAVGQ
ncbi:AAA family ATPase [Streptomyces lycii]|uniref:AAA family ATPase n=1 Tax=Streptomyces lycii TaxID=2654337 RepID=A0ABQ7FD06_9ACTN|nr:AAA family ATPase [Streptomyces lycii]KAF4405589.1 AAA family ATPase [Streptomyces lycii]